MKVNALDDGYEEKLIQLIDAAIEKAGSVEKLAEILDCDRSTIHRWKMLEHNLKNAREPKARDWFKMTNFIKKDCRIISSRSTHHY